MRIAPAGAPVGEARRALVLHDRPLVVDLIELTLNHGVFAVRAASSLAEAEAILAEWGPHMAVIDMDHDDSQELLERLGASSSLTRSATPVLGLTRRGDLKTKLRAFDLGVDDIRVRLHPHLHEHRLGSRVRREGAPLRSAAPLSFAGSDPAAPGRVGPLVLIASGSSLVPVARVVDDRAS